jgi:hypothetical protein
MLRHTTKLEKRDERVNKMKYNNIHMVDEINIHLNKDSNWIRFFIAIIILFCVCYSVIHSFPCSIIQIFIMLHSTGTFQLTLLFKMYKWSYKARQLDILVYFSYILLLIFLISRHSLSDFLLLWKQCSIIYQFFCITCILIILSWSKYSSQFL